MLKVIFNMSDYIFTREKLYERTMDFSVRVIRMVRNMPRGVAEDVVAKQLTKSATSIGANYREASHAKSPNDFAAKLKICESEAAETLYWLQLVINAGMMPENKIQALTTEAKELVAIFTAATKRAYSNRK